MSKVVGLVFEDQKTDKLACPHCGKEYATEEGLAQHIKNKHPSDDKGGDKDADN